MRRLVALMPEEQYLYFGDSANAPYGSRTTEEVRRLTLAAAEMLTKEDPLGCVCYALEWEQGVPAVLPVLEALQTEGADSPAAAAAVPAEDYN